MRRTLAYGVAGFSHYGRIPTWAYRARRVSSTPSGAGKPSGGKQYERHASRLTTTQRADFAASFQRAAVTALIAKIKRALERVDVGTLLVGGGVSANSRLRTELETLARDHRIELRLPAPEYCVDNAAMIAGLAAARYTAGLFDDWTLSPSTRSTVQAGRVTV